MDGLGRAYILPFWNGKTKRREATFIIGYKGMIDLARRSGELRTIHAQAVYQGDEFDFWEDEGGQHFTYRPNRNAPHTPDMLTDVYVTAKLKDGGFVFEHMTKEEVDAIRKRSKSADNGPWVTDYEAMALKTVIRRASRYLPMSTEAKQAIAADETTPNYSGVLSPIIEQPTPVEPEEVEVVEVEPEIAEEDIAFPEEVQE